MRYELVQNEFSFEIWECKTGSISYRVIVRVFIDSHERLTDESKRQIEDLRLIVKALNAYSIDLNKQTV